MGSARSVWITALGDRRRLVHVVNGATTTDRDWPRRLGIEIDPWEVPVAGTTILSPQGSQGIQASHGSRWNCESVRQGNHPWAVVVRSIDSPWGRTMEYRQNGG